MKTLISKIAGRYGSFVQRRLNFMPGFILLFFASVVPAAQADDDELFGNNPSWQFAVIANANKNLDTVYPMSGETVRARSILSWGFRQRFAC